MGASMRICGSACGIAWSAGEPQTQDSWQYT